MELIIEFIIGAISSVYIDLSNIYSLLLIGCVKLGFLSTIPIFCSGLTIYDLNSISLFPSNLNIS